MSDTRPNPQRDARIEDALWLLDSGEHPERVAARIGMTLASMEQMLRRAGKCQSPVYRAVNARRATRRVA